MFGACCSGQPLQMAQQVDALKYVIAFPQLPKNISHLSIFMLPNIEFDPNYTALIYFQINQPNMPLNPDFKLLGGLNLQKQSAIYKIKNHNSGNAPGSNFYNYNNGEMMLDDIDMDNESGPQELQEVLIGISIEPNDQAQMLLTSLKAQQQQQTPTQLLLTNSANANTPSIPLLSKVNLSNKVIENCYNYLSSFEDLNNKVPIAKFNEWWKRYIQKLENNPKLLDDN